MRDMPGHKYITGGRQENRERGRYRESETGRDSERDSEDGEGEKEIYTQKICAYLGDLA
jgi:hypothetical protein